MAVVLRSDIPVAPGTATTTSSTLTTASTTTVSASLYHDYMNLSASGTAGYTADLTTISISLTKRSLVVAVAVLMDVRADAVDVVDLILVIGGREVTYVRLKDVFSPYMLYGYRVLERGSYSVVLRLRNNDATTNHYVYFLGTPDTAGNKVVGYLVVYTIPLE